MIEGRKYEYKCNCGVIWFRSVLVTTGFVHRFPPCSSLYSGTYVPEEELLKLLRQSRIIKVI